MCRLIVVDVMLLQIHRRGESDLDAFVVEKASVVISTLYVGLLPGAHIHTLLWGVSDSQHPAQCVRLLQPNDSDLTGFRKPTSIFFEHFLRCVHRQTICLGWGGEGVGGGANKSMLSSS